MTLATGTMNLCRPSEAVTQGVRVRVEPAFEPDHSSPEEARFVFSYRITVSNHSERRVQLVDRRWVIIDSDGEPGVVEGEGVVGQQPVIEPGGSFTYASWCPLETRWGTMEGSFGFRAEPGDQFRAKVARFYLIAPESDPDAH